VTSRCHSGYVFVQIFHDVAYKARDRNDLLSGIDEFLDCVTVLPPGEWDPAIRIEPPKAVPSQVVTCHLYWFVGKDQCEVFCLAVNRSSLDCFDTV